MSGDTAPDMYPHCARLPLISILNNCASTARACASRAAEAVRARCDTTAGEFCRVEIKDGLREFGRDAEFELLIEIAIVQTPRPINAYQIATH